MSNVGRKNVYTCPTGHRTVTIDVDKGTTPFMMQCRERGGCPMMAESAMYDVPDDVGDPEWEWYRPTEDEARREDDRFPGMYTHFKKGGLFLRMIGEDLV